VVARTRSPYVLVGILAIALVAFAYVTQVRGQTHERGRAYLHAGCGDVVQPPSKIGADDARTKLLCLSNYERHKHGLAPLTANAQLELASDKQSADMVARRYFDHDTPDGVDPQQRIAAAGYNPPGGWTGENIAWGGGSDGSVAAQMDKLMHSPGHRENILRPEFREMGVGIAYGRPEGKTTGPRAMTITTDFGG
jgi:uncharacterized protein YkwD